MMQLTIIITSYKLHCGIYIAKIFAMLEISNCCGST